MTRALRPAIVALAALSAGRMAFDGARASVVGEYVTVDGELGPLERRSGAGD